MEAMVKREANQSLWYWKLYYHLLLYLHFALGIAGVVIGALIAANVQITPLGIGSQGLDVISTVIVGIVSFIQPGRMASVFFDAYWRLRIAVLRSGGSPTADEDLINALSNGYSAVAYVQPEVLRKETDNVLTLDTLELSSQRKEELLERFRELMAEENDEAAAKQAAGDRVT